MDERIDHLKEHLQNLMDEDALLPDEQRVALEEHPVLSRYWSDLNRLRGELRFGLDEAVRPSTDAAAERAIVRSVPRKRRRAARTIRSAQIVAASIFLVACGGIAFNRIFQAIDTRRMVREEVALLVNNLYSPDGPGLGTVAVPDPAGANNSGTFVEGVMSSVQAAVDFREHLHSH